MIRKRNSSSEAFTIVELLIVIVVIGILAAITIVAYNGVSGRANAASVQSDLASTARLLENAKTTSSLSAYPADQTAAQTAGMNSSVTYTPAMGGYCATKSVSGVAYMATSSNMKPHTGPGCTLTNLVTNPSIETVTTGWTAAANASVTRVNTAASTGSWSLQGAHTATATNGYISTPLTTVVGKKYSLSFDVRLISGSPALSATVKNTSATGTSPADVTTVAITPTTSFTRYTVTWTAENTSSYFVLDDPTVSTSYAIDGILATEGDNSFVYTDPTVAGSTWTWTGTAHASTSTGAAF